MAGPTDVLASVENDPRRAYSAYIGGCRIASFSGKIIERSFFRQRGLAHAVHEALALLQENGIVALSAETKTANGEHGLKRQPGLGFGPRLLQLAEIGQSGGEKKMRER